MPTNFYPSIATLLPLEAIPDNLGIVKDGLDNVFDHLYYKDLQIEKLGVDASGSYNLTLLMLKRIGVEIPGSGASLLLNPNFTEGGSSEFPISLKYKWDILKFVKQFDVQAFDWSAHSIFNLLLDIGGTSSSDLLLEAISIFIDDPDPIQKFVDEFNLTYSPPSPLVKGSDADQIVVIDNIIEQLRTNGNNYDPFTIIFDFFLNNQNFIGSEVLAKTELLFSNFLGQFSIDRIKDLILPRASLSVDNITLALEFPRSILIPLDTDADLDNDPETGPGDPLPESFKSLLTFNVGSLKYSTDNGIEFEELGSFSFAKSQIGNTGLTLEFTNMKLDLSRTSSIPEAAAAGYANDFVGVFVEEATIGLPPKLFKNDIDNPNNPSDVAIVGRNLLIGTGGISGTIGLETTGSPFRQKLGKMVVSLEAFDITFKQNAITESNIFGKILIHGFEDANGNDAEIDIDVHIADNGDFSITAKEADGIKLKIPNILSFTINSASIGKKDDEFFIAVSGLLEFEDQGGFLGKFLPSAIDIKKLVIWQDGSVEIEGGSLILAKAISIKIGPAELSITAIHLGTHEQSYQGKMRKYRYFGFDGGISVNPGGVDARGDGIKFYYTIDDGPRHTYMRIESLSIDLVIPMGASKEKAAVLISGYLAMKEPEGNDPDAGREYAGGVSITLPKPGIVGSAGMRYNPKVPSFIIDLSLEFPVPIPIFPPVGIYGFRGLLGKRYVASRESIGLASDSSWYEYYKKKVAPEYKEGVFVSKFETRKDGFSLGVGASIATTADGGRTFSCKVFFLLSLPEVFMIQGQAAILKERLGLDSTTDPPFSALLSVSKDSFESAFGINFKLPAGGEILQLEALLEMAYFKKNPSAWYVNVGRDLPENKRVKARILTLFNMYSYLMFSSKGIKMGAGVNFELKKSFGPIKVELGAYMDMMSRINFRPLQLGGGIQLGGYARLKVFGFKFGLSIDAALAAEAPKPFLVTGSLKICVRVLRKNRCASIDFTWTFSRTLDLSEILVLDSNNIMAVNVATGETFPLNFVSSSNETPPALSQWSQNFDNFIVPLDSYIDFEFNKGIGPGTGLTTIGKAAQSYVNYELVPPQKGKSPQIRHTYTVEEVKIWSLVEGTNNQWREYNIYDALTPLQDAQFVDATTLANLKEGWLQLDSDAKYKRLRMLSLSPLSYVNNGTDLSSFGLENLGLTEKDLFCPAPHIEKTCFTYESISVGTIVAPLKIKTSLNLIVRVLVPTTTSPSPKVVKSVNPFGHSRGLMLNPGDQYELVFKKPMAVIDLQLSTLSESVTVVYYKLEQVGETVSRQPKYDYVIIKTVTLQPTSLLVPVEYENILEPVRKIVVVAGQCSIGNGSGSNGSGSGGSNSGGSGGTGGNGGSDGGSGSGSGTGDDHDCHCDCVKCCGTTTPATTLPASDGNEVDALVNLYQKAKSQLDILTAQKIALQKENAQNQIALNRTLQLPASTSAARNDNLLLAARNRFKISDNLQKISKLQASIDQLNTLISQVQPLMNLIGVSGKNSQAAKDLAKSTFNVSGQTENFTCKTIIYEACYMSVDDYLQNQNTPTTDEVVFDLSSIVDGYSKTIHPLWRPDTTYAVTIKTKDQLAVDGSSSSNKVYEHFYHAGFRTKGPIGHFHNFVKRYQDLKKSDREDEFKLSTIRPYIDYGKCYPNADGRLTNAKPLFYFSPKLYLFYKFPLVYIMYNNFDPYNGNPAKTSSLKVLIKDPVEPIDTDPEVVIAQTGVGFVTNTIPVPSPDISFFNNLTRGSNCVQVVPVDPIGINTVVDPGPLKARKLYTAIFIARYNGTDAEVHRFAFVTSQYKDFTEQINSYKLYDDNGVFLKNALYDTIALSVTGDKLTRAAQLLIGTLPDTDPLVIVYQNPYDLLMTGFLEMSALDPAVTTEFNIIRNAATQSIIGFLIRNGEPFNDPKITPSVLTGSVELSMNGGAVSEHKTIFSKDNASIFISNSNLNIAPGEAVFKFKYFQFDGAQYKVLETTEVKLTIA